MGKQHDDQAAVDQVGRQHDGQYPVQEIQSLAAELTLVASNTLLRTHEAQIGFHGPPPVSLACSSALLFSRV
jgi:hypothetical protein